MKHYIAVGLIIVVALILGYEHFGSKAPQDVSLSGISRTVTNATSSVATSTGILVLNEDTRATYRRIQQDTNATVYCIEGATTTVGVSKGIRLTQGQDYVWSSDKHNLWPGKISCISLTTTSVLLTQQYYE